MTEERFTTSKGEPKGGMFHCVCAQARKENSIMSRAALRLMFWVKDKMEDVPILDIGTSGTSLGR